MLRKDNKLLATGKIWVWLFHRIKIPYLLYLFITFFYHYFTAVGTINFVNNIIVGKNSRGYGKIDWIFWKQNLHHLENPRWHANLVLILFLCFVFGGFLLNIFNFFLKRYCGELAKNWLRKLIIDKCQSSKKELVEKYKEEITSATFDYLSRLASHLVNIPISFFGNLLSIGFTSYSLYFYSKEFPQETQQIAINFSLIVLLIFCLYTLISGKGQGKRNIEKTKWLQQENKQIRANLDRLAFAREDANQTTKQTFILLDLNLQRNKNFFIQQTLSSLPSLYIPGLNITFCFFYYYFRDASFKDVREIYLMARDIQSIFWKLKYILEQIPDCQEAYGNYHNLKNLLGKLTLKNC